LLPYENLKIYKLDMDPDLEEMLYPDPDPDPHKTVGIQNTAFTPPPQLWTEVRNKMGLC
jgi:hypothetical protein